MNVTLDNGNDLVKDIFVFDTIESTVLSLSGPSSVAEGSTARYTVSVDHAPQTDLNIDVSYDYISASNNDIVAITKQVTIPANQTSAQFSVSAVADSIIEGIETFAVGIANFQGGNYKSLAIDNATVLTNIQSSGGGWGEVAP
jgi:PKD repeat protein